MKDITNDLIMSVSYSNTVGLVSDLVDMQLEQDKDNIW